MTAMWAIPPGLAGMPAGPEFDAVLDAIDPAQLCHDDALIVPAAEERQDGRTLSRKLAALCAVGRFAPGPDGHIHRLPQPSQWAHSDASTAPKPSPSIRHYQCPTIRTRHHSEAA